MLDESAIAGIGESLAKQAGIDMLGVLIVDTTAAPAKAGEIGRAHV